MTPPDDEFSRAAARAAAEGTRGRVNLSRGYYLQVEAAPGSALSIREHDPNDLQTGRFALQVPALAAAPPGYPADLPFLPSKPATVTSNGESTTAMWPTAGADEAGVLFARLVVLSQDENWILDRTSDTPASRTASFSRTHLRRDLAILLHGVPGVLLRQWEARS